VFTSDFWSWFIIVPVVVGIAALFWLNRAMTEPKRKAGDTAKIAGHLWDGDLEELNNPLPRWWLNLFYITLYFGIVYLLLYPGLGSFAGFLGWSQTGQYDREIQSAADRYGPLYEKYLRTKITELINDPEALKTGERLFATYCTTCHGSDARGALGFPNLRDDEWLFGGDPQAIETSIANGRTAIMPPWGAALGREGVFNVAEYVLSLSGKRVSATATAAGKEKYQQMCVACHGPEGKGNPALGAPSLTNDIWLYGGTQQAIMESIEKGRQGRMPAHKEFLGEAKVHLLATYVYSLSQSPASVAVPSKGGQ
jgi:cytochrome c oxidase cbb3-type subunit 3